jgi:hypothetical protein
MNEHHMFDDQCPGMCDENCPMRCQETKEYKTKVITGDLREKVSELNFLLDEIDEKIVNDTIICRSGVITHIELIRKEMDDIETELEKIIKIVRGDYD